MEILNLSAVLSAPIEALQNPGDRFSWTYLLMSVLLGAVWSCLVLRDSRTVMGGLGSLFQQFFSDWRSLWVDLLFTWVSLVLQGAVLTGLVGLMIRSVEDRTLRILETLPWITHFVPAESSSAGLLFETLLLTLSIDLGFFLAHWLQHRLPFLWSFHAVHHSAQSLTPFTAYRQHPVDLWVNALCIGPLAGFTLGLIHFYAGEPAHILTIGGSTLPFIAFYFAGYHLRHSPIWVHYGSFFSRVFISPAQHQIHHSALQIHQNRNLGYFFSLWDGLAGTLVIPTRRERLAYGLFEDNIPMNFTALMVDPFRRLLKKDPTSLVLGGLMLGVLSASLVTQDTPPSLTHSMAVNGVWMENMTSPEIADALSRGPMQVILPTGGTEQNGSHLTTGKHNQIIRANAERLALMLGDTLIAPVIAYVPEGQTQPREGHMRFPGTLSLREETFESLLEDASRSLKVQGFRTIFLLGDSGGNQSAQTRVAERLTHEWQEEGCAVVALSDYYRLEPQLRYLEMIGFTPAQIGQHAGIRDTSELEFIDPQSIRPSKLSEASPYSESSGDPSAASPEIGRALSEIKIHSALRQARQAEKPLREE